MTLQLKLRNSINNLKRQWLDIHQFLLSIKIFLIKKISLKYITKNLNFFCILNFKCITQAFETNLIIKKLVRTEANLYVLGKLRNDLMDKTIYNKEITDNGHQLCLYRLIIDEILKSQSHIEHQLVVSNLSLNEEKLLIQIDSEVKFKKKDIWHVFYTTFFV